MTDLTPAALDPKIVTIRESLLRLQGWLKPGALKWSRDGLDALSEIVAALDAERARAEVRERDLDAAAAVLRKWSAKNAALQVVVEAARDLCNQETDTYPQLQKALADVDTGRGVGRLRNLEAVAEAAREDGHEGQHGEVTGCPICVAVRRLDANEDTE